MVLIGLRERFIEEVINDWDIRKCRNCPGKEERRASKGGISMCKGTQIWNSREVHGKAQWQRISGGLGCCTFYSRKFCAKIKVCARKLLTWLPMIPSPWNSHPCVIPPPPFMDWIKWLTSNKENTEKMVDYEFHDWVTKDWLSSFHLVGILFLCVSSQVFALMERSHDKEQRAASG